MRRRMMGLYFSRQDTGDRTRTYDLQAVFDYEDHDGQAMVVGMLLNEFEDNMLVRGAPLSPRIHKYYGPQELAALATYVPTEDPDTHYWLLALRVRGVPFPYGILRLSPIAVGEPRGWEDVATSGVLSTMDHMGWPIHRDQA